MTDMSDSNPALLFRCSSFFGVGSCWQKSSAAAWFAFMVGLLFSSDVFSLDPNEVFRRASPSVVVVIGVGNEREGSLGSGVAIREQIVATNCHVIGAANTLLIRHAGNLFEATVFARDDSRDVCLLKMAFGKLDPVLIARAERVQPGDRVYAIGSPRGLEKTISEGLVSGIRWSENGQVIQTSAAISKGSSGGGLFDSEGRLVGLTTFFYADSQNLNFAIPASAAENLYGDSGGSSEEQKPGLNRDDNLANSVQSSLSAAPPVPEFNSAAQRLEYLRWLSSTEDRLKNKILDSQTRVEFLQTVWYESARAGLDVGLVLGLIEYSSEFRKFAIHASGARGYMQVAAKWSKNIGDGHVSKLFSTQVNLRFGCVILRHYMDVADGDARYALIRYFGQIHGKSYTLKDRRALDFSKSVLKAQSKWGVN